MSYAVSTSYPNVIRSAEPLLIRLNEWSLLVDNTSFWAKFKFGIQFKGYLIYVSGIGMPVMEVKFEENQLNGTGGTKRNDDFQMGVIKKFAKAWFDNLEEQLATQPNDSSIKKAIDRLCWQLHYDITESPTNFTQTFSDDDFSNVRIDTKLISTFNTIPDTVEDGCTIVKDGCIIIKDSIKSTSDGTLSYVMNKVAENLRGSGEYTISKALRDSDDSSAYGGTVRSVSCSVKLQTDVEEANFNEISVNQLGAFGVTNSHRTLYDTVGSYAASGNDTISETLDTVDLKIGTSSDSSATTVFGGVNSTLEKIGDSTDSTNISVWGGVNTTLDRIGQFKDNAYPGGVSDSSVTLFGLIGDSDRDGKNLPSDNYKTVMYNILRRSGSRDMNGALLQSDSVAQKIIDGAGSGSTSTINTINTNVSTIMSRLGTPSSGNTIWSGIDWISGSVVNQNVNGATFRVSRSTLPVNYESNLW